MKTAFTIILNFFAFIILAQVTVTELSHPTAIPSDQFGSSASISDDFAAVGAYLKNDQIGTVSIFKRENDDWVFSEELSPSDNFEDGLFGRSCAMTNKTLIVGAPGQNWPNDKIGQAYIYTKQNNQWLESTILIPDESYVQSSFGTMVGTTDNYSIIGAPGYNITIGRAIIYKNKDNNWEEDIVLNNPNQSQLNFYGSSLSITDDWAVVGGYNNLQSNNQSMFISVYQNVNGEWTFFQNIDIPLLHNIYSVRSYNLSIENNKLLVGGFLPYNNNKDIGVGGIFVYELNDNEWTLQQDIKPDGYEDYEIGKGVSLSKNFAFIGTQKQSTTNPDSIQSILIYEREDDDSWNQILNYQLPNDSSSFSIHSGNNFGIIASSKEIDKEGIVFVFDLRTLSTTSLTLKDPSISMFPNPCHDFLQIRGSNKIESVNVYDITGQLFLVKKKTNITELNVKSWPKGIYTIQMKSKDHYISKKVIKN